MKSLTATLDPNQKKAVLHTKGPLLILAGAGSGKTRVLTFRIARLIKEKHCKAENILAVTFTNKAAKEMRERIAKLTSKKAAQAMTVSTFHSFGARVLRTHGKHIGVSSGFSILSDSERISTLKSIMRTTSTALLKENPNEFGTQISLAKNDSLSPEEFEKQNPDDRKTQRVYANYKAFLKQRQSLDFDDLLLMPLQLFKKHPKVLALYRKKYKFLSIDEFQDTNTVQMQLCNLLAKPHNNIMVVGDDDQGIYSWRGAKIDNILRFSSKFKGCKTVILDRNYRSVPEIVLGAAGVIARNEVRKLKNIKAVVRSSSPIQTFQADDENVEVQWIVGTIMDNHKSGNYAYKDHALLFRTNAQMARFEEELRIQRIPYEIQGGMSFFERKEIKDILAYLRFFANTYDELSLQRVLKVPNRGITKTTMEAIEELAGRRKLPLWTAFRKHDHIGNLPSTQKEKLAAFVDFFDRHEGNFKRGVLAETLRVMLDECNYTTLLEKAYKNDKSLPMRLDNVQEIIHSLELFEKKNKKSKSTLDRYLQECALLANDDPDEETRSKGVMIMTLHKSKGLEFPVVCLPLLDDAVFPSSRSCEEGKIEEERRLFYVGMTRARRHLILSAPRTKLFRKKSYPVKPCRFIFEIPQEYLDGKFGEQEEEKLQKENVDFFAELRKKLEKKDQVH